MRKRSGPIAVGAGVLALAMLAAACGRNGDATGSNGGAGLTGAGATFPDPIYEQWFRDFRTATGAKINYQPIGSGGGVQQFTARTVDFGASDAPLQADEVSALPAGAVEIPTVIGGVAVAYNLSGVKSGLKLDGPTVAKIFLGSITKWNDPAIAGQNAGVTLPDGDISVVHRSDESGTTKVFTSWLSAESADWESQVGADKAVQWPVGIGGDGNDGVAAGMQQTPDSIGYLSFDFAVKSSFGSASIKRDDGTYVEPSVESISKAGGDLKFPIPPDTSILNSATSGAYPISTTTYLLVYKDQTDRAKGQTLVDFIDWALTKGQDEVTTLNYSPLPSSIQKQALDLLKQITSNGSAIQSSSSVT